MRVVVPIALAILCGCSGGGSSNPEPVRVLLYGDSIRMGWEEEFRAVSQDRYTVISTGIFNGLDSAAMSAFMQSWYDVDGDVCEFTTAWTYQRCVDAAVLNVGINDAIAARPAATYAANWRDALDALFGKLPVCRVAVNLSTPLDDPVLDGRINPYNQQLVLIVAEYQSAGFDIRANDLNAFVRDNALPRGDGIHYDYPESAQLAHQILAFLAD